MSDKKPTNYADDPYEEKADMARQDYVDELTNKRDEEHKERTLNAQQVARSLSTLMLGEIIEISNEQTVMAVPNGWIFTSTHKAGITSTFVPGAAVVTQRPVDTKQKIFMPNGSMQ